MREIVFDTETTGLSFTSGDRMVEIGCVEMVNRVETGRTFHAYFHPERSMPAEAQRIHGLSDVFLSDKPRFHEKVEELLEFIGDAMLVAHNASVRFRLPQRRTRQIGREIIALERMIDTVAMARQRHPGAKHSLDALCTRYGIDRSHRVLHGALLDAQLLVSGLCRADRRPPDRADVGQRRGHRDPRARRGSARRAAAADASFSGRAATNWRATPRSSPS